MAAYERQVRAAEREQEIAAVAELEQRLARAHLETFEPARRPTAPPPEPVDRNALVKQHRREQRRGVSVVHRTARKEAKERADELAAVAVDTEQRRRYREHQRQQAELDAGWQALNANDPDLVLALLEEAFADNDAPAAAVNCEDDRATIVMLAPGFDVVPERKPAVTPSGKPTLKKRTKSEANDLYVSVIASNVLATVKEAFAVAPGLGRAVVLVVRKQASAGLGPDRVEALFCGTFSRGLLDGVNWAGIDLVRVLDEVPDALITRRGRAGELGALDVGDEPELRGMLETVQTALAAEG